MKTVYSARQTPEHAGSTRALLAASGAVAATAAMLYPVPLGSSVALSLAPAAVMLIVLLAGWRIALLACLGVMLAGMLLQSRSWEHALLVVAAVPCGEALRRGIRPGAPFLVLLLAGLAAGLPQLAGGSPAARPGVISTGIAQAGINLSLALAVLAVLPRRSPRLVPRGRFRWTHLTFLLTTGTASVAALALLAGAPATISDARLVALFVTALAVGQIMDRWYSTLPQRYPAGIPPLPLEPALRIARLRHAWKRLQRSAARSAQQIEQTQRSAAELGSELQRTQDTLQQRIRSLEELALACDEARARWRVLMSDSPDGTIFSNEESVIQSVSPRAAMLLGTQPAELIGKPVHALIPRDHITQHPLDLAWREQPEQDSGPTEGPISAPGGTLRQMSLRILPFAVRGTRHHLIRLQNPEDAGQTRETLEMARKLSRDADQRRDLFIASMSHELRTPLHGLIATLDMLRAGGGSDDESRHQLSIARSSARALLKIANDVLDFTRIKSSLFALERKYFDLPDLVREVVDEERARANSLNLALSVTVSSPMPPSFVGDPARLKQILGNLVSNALKFTTSGGVTLQVCHDGKLCTVDVRDTGGGIPAARRDSIFEPFVQLDQPSRPRTGGTGLGLPISRRLAEAMNGNLVLLDSGPQGSTFRLTLPLEASDEEPSDEQSQRILLKPRGRILVVEDNPANRYVAQAMLVGLDCPATIVESGQEALRLLREQEFDLILMDCQMPGMDGYETTRRARRLLPARVPIIAMTANAMSEDRSHCIEAGMDDFLPKPFDRHALNALLCKWLAAAPEGAQAGDADARIGMHPDLDIAVLDELRENLKWRIAPLEKIREAFSSSVERALQLLETGELQRDALPRQLHTLVGSAGMVGARQVEYIARQIQLAVRENRYDALDGTAEILRRALRRYEREFERRLDMGAGTDDYRQQIP